MDQENEASKMIIIWLPVLGNQKQVQDKLINGHLTDVTKRKILLAHQDSSTLQELSIESGNIMQMHLVESLFSSQN